MGGADVFISNQTHTVNTTIVIIKGNVDSLPLKYRYKRLALGGLNSQDLFESERAEIISGIPRVLKNREDIMVGGVD